MIHSNFNTVFNSILSENKLNKHKKHHRSKFDIVFEQSMRSKKLHGNSALIIECAMNPELSLIVEEISKPQYIINESGDAFLLEDVMDMSESQIIAEGIDFHAITDKFKALFEKIGQGIKNVINKGSEVIKEFCKKALDNAIVKKMREKLGLDNLINKEKLKPFFKISKNKSILKESKSVKDKRYLILEKRISDWDAKLKEERELLADLKEQKSQTDDPEEKLELQRKIKSTNERIRNAKKHLNASKEEQQEVKNGDESTDSSKKKSSTEERLGKLEVDVENLKAALEEAKKAALENKKETASAAAEISGGSEDKEKPKEEKKKGFFSRMADKAGNALKSGIQKVAGKATDWFMKQNKIVQMIIKAILVLLTIMAICAILYWVIAVFVGMLASGIPGVIGGAIQIYFGSQKIKAAVKDGQKAWKEGSGWGKFFLDVIGVVMTVCSLSAFAAKGMEMMSSKDDEGGSSSGQQEAEEKKPEKKAERKHDDKHDINHKEDDNDNNNDDETPKEKSQNINNKPLGIDENDFGLDVSDVVLNKVKNGNLLDLNDPRYLGDNGYSAFKEDLANVPEIKKYLESTDPDNEVEFWETLDLQLRDLARIKDGVSEQTQHGYGFFQKALGIK